MKKSELKELITEAINEVVAEMAASKDINKEIGLLLKQGKKVFSSAAGRVGEIEKVDQNNVFIKSPSGRRGVTSFNGGDTVAIKPQNDGTFIVSNTGASGKSGAQTWDNSLEEALPPRNDPKGRNRDRVDHSSEPSFIASIDNNVFPFGEDELDKMAEEHHIRLRYLGDAAFGTETLASYRVKVAAKAQGQLDAFVDMLAQEKGIQFFNTPELAKKLEEGAMMQAFNAAVLVPRGAK